MPTKTGLSSLPMSLLLHMFTPGGKNMSTTISKDEIHQRTNPHPIIAIAQPASPFEDLKRANRQVVPEVKLAIEVVFETDGESYKKQSRLSIKCADV